MPLKRRDRHLVHAAQVLVYTASTGSADERKLCLHRRAKLGRSESRQYQPTVQRRSQGFATRPSPRPVGSAKSLAVTAGPRPA